jgi:hypothetical protein
MKYNKTELKLLARIEFYKCLGFCGLDRSTGVRMRQAARSLSEKGIVTIEDHKHDKTIWLVRMVAA